MNWYLYRCKHCGKYVRRIEGKPKKWIKSYCESAGRDVHLILVTGEEKEWAIRTDEKLRSEIVEQITENEDGFRYQTSSGGYYNEDQVFPVSDAKKIALKFLAECMIILAEKESPCPHNS